MALIKCPECKVDVSDLAKTCPKCNYPLKKSNNLKFFARVISIVFGVFYLILNSLPFIGNNNNVSLSITYIVFNILMISTSFLQRMIATFVSLFLGVIYLVIRFINYNSSAPTHEIFHSIFGIIFIVLSFIYLFSSDD